MAATRRGKRPSKRPARTASSARPATQTKAHGRSARRASSNGSGGQHGAAARKRPARDAAERLVLTALAPAIQDPSSTRELRRKVEILETFGLDPSELAQLERSGVLELRGQGDGAGYGGLDLELLDLLAEVRRQGLGDLFPISVAGPYMMAVRKLVDFEIEVFRERALRHDLGISLADIATSGIPLGERLISILRRKVLPAQLLRLGR